MQALLVELERGGKETVVARMAHVMCAVEATLTREVSQMRALVRLGPCLGLAGTLIPLGPGLMALSEGDLNQLSVQLVVAFSTTVLGLLVGGVSYVLAMGRAYSADLLLGDLELIGDLVRADLQVAQIACTEAAHGDIEDRKDAG